MRSWGGFRCRLVGRTARAGSGHWGAHFEAVAAGGEDVGAVEAAVFIAGQRHADAVDYQSGRLAALCVTRFGCGGCFGCGRYSAANAGGVGLACGVLTEAAG